MKTVRLWSICNIGWLKKCCAALEGAVKGFLFDSQSCGQCTLGETGMAYRMEDRIGEIVTRSNALGGREPWRPAA